MTLLNIKETAKILKVSRETVARRIKCGDWPFYRIGERGVRLDLEEIKGLSRTRAIIEQGRNQETMEKG